jgi:aspartyl-tRNA(Asn)/glutamyl-tRNA(Gln) amidotransferase subunit C
MKVTAADVRHIADLSRLSVTAEEVERLSIELSTIIEYVEQLSTVETRQIEPTSHVLPLKNVMRDDRLGESLPRDAALRNAPDSTEKFYRVPRIID